MTLSREAISWILWSLRRGGSRANKRRLGGKKTTRRTLLLLDLFHFTYRSQRQSWPSESILVKSVAHDCVFGFSLELPSETIVFAIKETPRADLA